MSANWLFGFEPNRCQNKLLFTWLKTGCDSRSHQNCRQIHLTRHFSSCTLHFVILCILTTWLKNVFVRITPYSWIHDERFDRLFSLCASLCSFPSLLFPLWLVLCPEPLLPCGQRRGKHYLRLRQSRSLALWQKLTPPTLWDLIVAVLHGNTCQSNSRTESTSQISNTKEISWNDWWSRQCLFHFLKRSFFSPRSFVENLWRQRNGDQDDHKGKKPYNETCFPGPTEFALDWFFHRINLDPKIQIKHIDTKNQLADILTKGNFTRDEWDHIFCVCSTSAISSSINSLETMSKRTQEDAGEERVTAKSKPMMNLV